MQFLTMMAMTQAEEPLASMSCGGLVDMDTAAADPVVLWTDPESLACMERAVAAQRLRPLGARLATQVA
jgi:hypothetical protein